jgi:NADH-quinone oxidoreductase subunit A
MIGKLVRPKRPDPEKLTVYECGEPTIGSAWVQFDLRFYVVALLFVIFDVEMALFFPWAVVFGKANQLAGNSLTAEQRQQTAELLDPQFSRRIDEMDKVIQQRVQGIERREKEIDGIDKKLEAPNLTASEKTTLNTDRDRLNREIQRLKDQPDREQEIERRTQASSANFAYIAFLDILVFFAVLLVGFAYLWRRGDLNWVRSTAAQEQPPKLDTEESGRAPMATIV